MTNQLFDLNYTLFPHLFHDEPWHILNLLENMLLSVFSLADPQRKNRFVTVSCLIHHLIHVNIR